MHSRLVSTFAASALIGLVLAGCSAPPVEDEGEISIVASTNVWGDVAQSIAGERATVTSLITGAAQDPHSFEASVRDQLAISKADLIIENGGGYDPFMTALLESSNNDEAIIIDAADESGLLPGNEHVWYDFRAVDTVALSLSQHLATIDPGNAAEYTANYDAFAAELAVLEAAAVELTAKVAGQGVAITEPLPVYLLDAVGMVNKTPEAFSEAFEEGTDIPPTALRDTLALFTGGAVTLLAYNDQTTSVQGEQVLAAAQTAGIAVVPFAETLPEGHDYASWMTMNLEAIEAAIAP